MPRENGERIDMSKFENKLCPVCRAPFTGGIFCAIAPRKNVVFGDILLCENVIPTRVVLLL